MYRLDAKLMDRCRRPLEQMTARQCKNLASDLGALSRWILHPLVLERAAEEWEALENPREGALLRQQPGLPCLRGSCWVAFVADRGRFPALSEACVLPLRWDRCGKGEGKMGHDLPEPLRREAAGVLQTLLAFRTGGERTDPTDWRLCLAVDDRPDLYDLSGLDELMGTSSGWAALAAGWLLASRGGQVNTGIWASARWTENGLQAVDGLAEKLRLAGRWGAKRFYIVPAQNDVELASVAAELNIELCELEEGTANPIQALRPLTRALAVRPDPPVDGQSFAEATKYYHLLASTLADRDGAEAFYRESVMPAIIKECRSQVEKLDAALLKERGSLITILSGSPTLVELAVRIFEPRRCLLLYTEQTAGSLREAERRLGQNSCAVTPTRIDRRFEPGCLPPEVHAFAGGEGPVLIDLTPGTKLMTLAMYHDLAGERVRRFYFETEQRGAEIQFGTYRVVLL